MNEGAFALIDCLGFKGIWKRTDPVLLLQKFAKIEQMVHAQISLEDKAFTSLSYGPIDLNVRLLSDTVAISLQYKLQKNSTPTNEQKDYLVGIMCSSIIQVLDLFLESEPALVLRGCVSYGEHLMKGNFIVGPAVDQAAEYMNIAEGAFIWLLPSAEERYKKLMLRNKFYVSSLTPEIVQSVSKGLQDKDVHVLDKVFETIEIDSEEPDIKSLTILLSALLQAPTVISFFDMPLKTGSRLKCSVVNPLLSKNKEERKKTIKKYSEIISGERLDIWLKRQNTLEFLEFADSKCAQFDMLFPHKKS